jgi:hypothetical protein
MGNSPEWNEWNEIAIAIGFPSSIYLLRSDPTADAVEM